MKLLPLLLTLSGLLLNVQADKHGACGCQINTDGAIHTDSTKECCNRFSGQLAYLGIGRNVRFAGYYCFKDGIDGKSFYDCCRQFDGVGDSACPW